MIVVPHYIEKMFQRLSVIPAILKSAQFKRRVEVDTQRRKAARAARKEQRLMEKEEQQTRARQVRFYSLQLSKQLA